MTGKEDVAKDSIFKNSIQYRHCGDIIVSERPRLEAVQVRACFVDGGKDYLLRGYKTKAEDDFIELSEFED